MDNNTINKDEPPKTEKISNTDNYISYSLLQQIIKETNIPKKVIEEKNSELWYETLSGKGKVFFTNNTTYSGFIKNGIFVLSARINMIGEILLKEIMGLILPRKNITSLKQC